MAFELATAVDDDDNKRQRRWECWVHIRVCRNVRCRARGGNGVNKLLVTQIYLSTFWISASLSLSQSAFRRFADQRARRMYGTGLRQCYFSFSNLSHLFLGCHLCIWLFLVWYREWLISHAVKLFMCVCIECRAVECGVPSRRSKNNVAFIKSFNFSILPATDRGTSMHACHPLPFVDYFSFPYAEIQPAHCAHKTLPHSMAKSYVIVSDAGAHLAKGC